MERDFRNDLQLLLDQYGAELEITDDGEPYGGHRAIVVITIMGKWKNGDLVRNFCEFTL